MQLDKPKILALSVLKTTVPGSFCIRSNELRPETMILSYVDLRQAVKHEVIFPGPNATGIYLKVLNPNKIYKSITEMVEHLSGVNTCLPCPLFCAFETRRVTIDGWRETYNTDDDLPPEPLRSRKL